MLPFTQDQLLKVFAEGATPAGLANDLARALRPGLEIYAAFLNAECSSP